MIATETTFPAISVIMGTYNPDKRIEAAVLSIIQQTEINWELIICDDGSDEKHAKYIESVCCSNSKIRMIRNDSNRGLAYSLNRCLKLSRGEFIARMDDDDISMPDRFTCQLQFLQNNPQYGWVGSQAVLYDEYGDWGVAERPKIPGTKDFLPFSPYIHSSVMFRSDVLKKTKGYMVSDRTRLCEDYELFMRLHTEGERGFNLQDKLLKYYEDRYRNHLMTLSRCVHESQIRAYSFSRLGIDPAETILFSAKPLAVAAVGKIPGFYKTVKKFRKRGNYSRPTREECYGKILKSDPIMGRAISGSQNIGYSLNKQIVQNTVTNMVLAPIVNYFTQWVLVQARYYGIKRLYFLSRDGYLMYNNALKYCKAFQLDIDCKFFYCSRYSLRVPLYHRDMDKAMEHIFRNGIDVTLRRILLRAGIDEKDSVEFAEHLKIDKELLDKRLSFQELQVWKTNLNKNESFKDYVAEHSKACWRALTGYFQQEGLTDQVPMALVDSGWTGTTQESFQHILNEMKCGVQLHGFYFGLYETPSTMNRARYHAFYFSPSHEFLRKVRFSNCLFECLFSAPFGTTIGYEQVYDTYKPILRECSASIEERIKAEETRILEITDQYLMYLLENGAAALSETPRSLKITQELLEKLMWTPTIDEAEVLGDFLFSDDLLDMNMQKIAPEFDDHELFKNHLPYMVLNRLGILNSPIRESAWFCGTAVKNNRHYKWHRMSNGLYRSLMYLRKTAIFK